MTQEPPEPSATAGPGPGAPAGAHPAELGGGAAGSARVQLDVVFYGACVEKRPLPLTSERSRQSSDLLGLLRQTEWAEPSASERGWQRPASGWRLPVYDGYPETLKAELRWLLPLCYAEWTPPRPAGGSVAVESTHNNVMYDLELIEESVTAWTPNVLLAKQRVRTFIDPQVSLYDLVETLQESVEESQTMQALVDRALASPPAELKPLTQLVATIDRKLMWVVGTAYPTGADCDAVYLADAERTQARSSSKDVGRLHVFVKELVTVVVPRAQGADGAATAASTDLDDFDLLMGMQNFVWGLAVNYDLELLERIAKTNVDILKRGLVDVEDHGRELVLLFHEVAAFRAKLESLQIHLAREASEYWTYLNETWELNAYVTSLGSKMDAIIQLHQEITAAVRSLRERRIGRTAFAFTALGIVSVGVAIAEFMTKDVEDWKPTEMQGLVLVLAFAAVALLAFWLYWRGDRRKLRARRNALALRPDD